MAFDLKSKTISGVKWSSVSMLGGTLLHFATLAVLARLLLPSDFGLMGMVMVVVGFSQAFADMGLSNAIIQRKEVKVSQLSSFYWINVFMGVLLFGAVFLMRSPAAQYFKEPALKNYLLYTSFIFLITPWGQLFQTLLKRDLRFKELTKIDISGAAVYALTAISLALAKQGVLSLIVGQLCRSLFTVIILIFTFRNKWLPRLYFNIQEIKSYLSFGAFQLGERILNYFRTNIDYIFIGRLLGPASLGFYSLAYQIMVFPLNKINPIFTQVAFPAFSKIQEDDSRIRNGFCKVINYISMLSFPMLAGMVIVAPQFIRVFYGSKWEPVIIILQIFCLVGALISLANPLGSVLLAKGRADIGFYWNVFGVLRIFLAVVIGIKWGIRGVATAILISQIPVLFILQGIVNRLIGLRFKRYFSTLRVPFLSTLIMLTGILLLKLLFLKIELTDPASLVIMIVVGILLYSASYYLFDREFLKELISIIKRK